MNSSDQFGFIPPHGHYRELLSYQQAEVVYDLTFRFCERFLKRGDRTIAQMVQVARSGKQNIAEGSRASGASLTQSSRGAKPIKVSGGLCYGAAMNRQTDQPTNQVILAISEGPEDPERNRQMALYRRNAEWISEHWKLLADEQYRGRFVAVSEGEIFVADDRWEALKLARERHPHDEPFTQYIPKERYERIYAC